MKSIFKSKVFYFNALTILVVVASMFGYVPDERTADVASNTLLALSPIVNLVLRFFTAQAVSLTGK